MGMCDFGCGSICDCWRRSAEYKLTSAQIRTGTEMHGEPARGTIDLKVTPLGSSHDQDLHGPLIPRLEVPHWLI